MKKQNLAEKINGAIAKASLSSAHAGAGVMSRWGFYQPKVPKRIAK